MHSSSRPRAPAAPHVYPSRCPGRVRHAAPTRPCCRGSCCQGDRAAPACEQCSPSHQGTRGRPAPSPPASSTQPRTSGPCCRKLSTEGHVSRVYVRPHSADCARPATAPRPRAQLPHTAGSRAGQGLGSACRKARLALSPCRPGFQKKLISSKLTFFYSSSTDLQQIEQNWGMGMLQFRAQTQLRSV